MGFEVKPAARKRVLARVSMVAPSGGGKTFSAIRFARGLVGPEGKIVLVDTEHGSSNMYAGQSGGFDVVELDAPYTPERYAEALTAAEASLVSVPLDKRAVIVDSLSHAWSGEGGLLEWVDSQTTRGGGREGFAAWKKGTPKQNAFLERLLATQGHLIVTMRQKAEWVIEKNEKGFSEPRKVGLAPIQRPGTEYEFQVEFDLDQETHKAKVSKDRTSLFDGRVFVPSEAEGARLREFLMAGEGALLPPTVAPPAPVQIGAPEVQTLIAAAKAAKLDKSQFLDVVGVTAAHRIPSKLTMPEYQAVLEALQGLALLAAEEV